MLPICFSKAFDTGRADLAESIKNKAPSSYEDLLVRTLDVVSANYDGEEDCDFNTDGIESVYTGSYQGSIYFLIGTNGYSEDAYTACVSYGSCSHCDQFEGIQSMHGGLFDDDDAGCDDDAACDAYVRLCLHLFQSLKKIV